MTDRTGLGFLEVTALRAVDASVGAEPFVQSLVVLQRLEGDGFGPAYVYPVLQDLAVPWKVQLPLLEGQGNFGSPGNDPAADARYTEIGLSDLGRLALDAERGRVGPVPIGLIEGSAYRGGAVPPFAPSAILQAVDRLLDTGDAPSDEELDGIVGVPELPTGGDVQADVAALLRGEMVTAQMSCRIEREQIGDAVAFAIRGFPLLGNPDEIADAVATRAREPDPRRGGGAPYLGDVQDHSSSRNGIRLLVVLRPGVEVDSAETWLRSIWPVTVEVDWRLPAPMPQRLRAFADAARVDRSGYDAFRAHI